MKGSIRPAYQWRDTIRFLIVAPFLMGTAFAQDGRLTAMQERLVELNTYLFTAARLCRFELRIDVLRRVYRDAGLEAEDRAGLRIASEKLKDAETKFTGLKRSVECAYAIERFGPAGSEFPGLLRRSDP